MIPRALRSFIADLIDATADKTISWAEGAPDSYFCTHKSYNLHINNYFDGDSGISYINFRIVQGSKDASFSVSSDETADFLNMKGLYSSIAINASNFENIAEDFFADSK